MLVWRFEGPADGCSVGGRRGSESVAGEGEAGISIAWLDTARLCPLAESWLDGKARETADALSLEADAGRARSPIIGRSGRGEVRPLPCAPPRRDGGMRTRRESVGRVGWAMGTALAAMGGASSSDESSSMRPGAWRGSNLGPFLVAELGTRKSAKATAKSPPLKRSGSRAKAV